MSPPPSAVPDAVPGLVLASASPARLAVLRAAGLDPRVLVSGIDEDSVLTALAGTDEDTRLAGLAAAKAEAVVDRVTGPAVIIGCDSMLLLDGELVGKPYEVSRARQRWSRMAGRTGQLLTGHAVVRLDESGALLSRAAGTRRTTVRFADPSAAEVEAYLATGEPLAVAGAFTLDGLGGWFVDSIDGDPSNVIGISLPLLRSLLARVGVAVTELWRGPGGASAAQ